MDLAQPSCGVLLLYLIGLPILVLLLVAGMVLFLALSGPAIGNVFSNITIGI